MNKVCVIGIYFGQLPPYFPLWLKSCGRNPTVDFLLYTDSAIDSVPDNVKVIPATLGQMRQRASDAAGFAVSLERPYKLCDYRPLYGKMFRRELAGYDYWGHCDFDMIFGDLQASFDRHELYQYHRFNALGHLSLYRSTEEVSEYYKLPGGVCDYRQVFTEERNFIFDELCGMTAKLLENDIPVFTRQIYADIATVHDRYRIIDEYPLDRSTKNYPEQLFYWENGQCFRAYFAGGQLHRDELQYIHFQRRPKFPLTFEPDSVDAFYITKFGFFPKTGDVTREDIRRYNPYKGRLYEWGERVRYEINSKAHSAANRLRRK